MGMLRRPLSVLAALVAAFVVSLPAWAPRLHAQRPLLGAQCVFNDECAPGLICAGTVCRVQCRTARDCQRGDVCQTLVIDSQERVLRKALPNEAISVATRELLGEPGHYLRPRCVPDGFQAPDAPISRPAQPAAPALPPPVVKPGTSVASGALIETDTIRSGSDYRSFETKDGPNGCATACSGEARCRAWTWMKAGIKSKAAICALKDSVPAPTADACCASGVKR
jgi:PAN domain